MRLSWFKFTGILLLVSQLLSYSNGYVCGPDGRLDCRTAGITDPLVIKLGGKGELKDCLYSRCPSIFVDGGELTLKTVTISDSEPVIGASSVSVQNGVLKVISSTIMNATAFRGAGILANNSVVSVEDSTFSGLNDIMIASLHGRGGALAIYSSIRESPLVSVVACMLKTAYSSAPIVRFQETALQ